MGKKLLLIPLWILFCLPNLLWGQCPSSVSISADTGNTICEGSSVTFTATPATDGSGNYSYQWLINGSNAPGTSTNSTYTTNSLTNGDDVNVVVTENPDSGCSETSNTIQMTVNPDRTGSVSIQASNTTICPGDNINFSIASSSNLGTNADYTWERTRGGNTSTVSNTSSFSTTDLQDEDVFTLSVQSYVPCVSPNPIISTNSISITVKPGTPSQPGSITPPAEPLCPGNSVEYSISPVNGATEYVWTLPSGWTGSSTGTSITTTVGTTGGNISVAAKNDCGTGAVSNLAVSPLPGKPNTPGSITGETAVCPGITKTYSISAVTNATSYTWTLPTGWNGGSISFTTNSPSIDITTGNTGNDGNISVIANNSCESSDPRTLAVSVKSGKPNQPSSITGEAAVCPGVSKTYSITNVPGLIYTWNLPPGWVGNSTANSITVTTGSTGGDISVTAKNDCDESDPRIFSVNVKAGTPASPGNFTSGPNSLCPNTTGTYTVPSVTGATEYVWTLPSGFSTPNLTTTTPSIVVTAGASGSGNISVVARNDCGTSSARSIAVSIANPAPVMTGNISGPTKVCAGSSGIQYSIPAITNAATYTWTLPTNWTITNGQNTNTITVSTPATTSSNNTISVVASNSCGTTNSKSISVNSSNNVPAQPGTISTDLPSTAICPPVSGYKFWVTPVSGTTYNWIVPNGFQITGGAGTNEITVNINSNTPYGNNIRVEVEAVNACGPSNRRVYNNISIDNFAYADLGADQLVCSATNQLNLNGTVGFGSGNTKLKIQSLTSTGTNQVQNIPNGKVNDFSYRYTPSSQDISNGQVTFTLTTESPTGNNNCSAQGVDQMTIFFRPVPTVSIAGNSPVCAGQTSTLTFTGTPNTRVTYRIGSGADQTIDIGSEGTASLTTTTLNANTTYNLRSIQYLDSPACNVSNLSGSATISVTQPPTATISYNGPFCTTQNSLQNVTLSGTNAYTGGTFNQPAGLSIDSSGSINPGLSSAGEYTVIYTTPASGNCPSVTASTQVVINEETIITGQPVDTRACEGDDISFEVFASGENLTYQWYFDSVASGNEVTGATNANLTLTNISEAQEGNYYVVVDNTASCAAVTSNPVQLIVDQEIIIENQPVDTTVCEGETTSLEITATSGGSPLDGTFTYQWYKGTPGSGTLLSGLNASSIPFDNAQISDSGDYYVEITGSGDFTCQPIASQVASLTVRPSPSVEISGDNSICDGESAEIYFENGTPNTVVTFTINGDNTNPQTVNLDNSGVATLNTGALVATNDSDTPFVYELASIAYPDDPTCSANLSGSATITVTPNPIVTIAFPDDQVEFCTLNDEEFTPVLSGTGTYTGGSFSSNGLNVDPTDGSFNPANNTPGNYTIDYLIPAYGGCPEENISLDISIYEEVVITTEPFNVGICSTNDAEFSVAATGDNLTYQWYKVVDNPDIESGINETNDIALNGETSAILSLPVATSSDAGDYYVRISGTNACTPTEDTQVNSEVVSLNVDEDIVIILPAEDMAVCSSGEENVTFEFVAHADGAVLSFEWIYANGSPVLVNEDDPSGRYTSQVNQVSDYEGSGIDVYVGTLTINNIIAGDQASYAVKINGPSNFTCPEAISNSFNLDVNAIPEPPETQDLTFCVGDTASPLTASGENGATFTWYDANMNVLNEAPTPSTSSASVQTYYVTQTDYIPDSDIYCESETATITVTVNDLPVAPPLTAEELNVNYCLGATATNLTATSSGTGFSINWYGPNDPEVALGSAPTPQTTSQGSISYWVSQTDGNTCESEKVLISVNINNLPDISISNSGNDTVCEGAQVTLTATDANEATASSTTFEWTWDTGTGSETGTQMDFNPTETTTYTVTATNEWGCINTEQITINVDSPPAGGTLTGPGTVCEANPSGSLDLTEFTGSITQWEYKAESDTDWTVINETTPDANYMFSDLTEPTNFRVLVSNGVCDGEYSNEVTVNIDLIPRGGELTWAANGERLFLTCQNPAPGYGSALNLNAHQGTIIQWEYRGVSANAWQTLDTDATSLTSAQVEGMVLNETTAIRVRIEGNSCGPDVYSSTAMVSVIEADIKPAPVEVDKKVICIGDTITLSSETGYGAEGGKFDGGAFDNAALDNSNTWRFQDADGTVYNFESSANNGRANHWLRMNPHGNNPNPNEKVYTANLYPIDQQGPGNGYMVNFRTFSTNAGNKGFALVTGNNDSNFETPIFSLGGLDEAILTWDQAYNLTEGAKITVEISTNGGSTYQNVLFDTIGTATSGNYDNFGDGTPATRPLNKMVVDLGAYIGMSNLRLRWRYEGTIDGDVWAVDNIKVPEGPQDILLQWYYDDDLNDPDNYLEPIGDVNQYTVNFVPRKIGWNDFEVQTRIILDSNGDECQSIDNFETIRVWAFDRYETNVEAIVGACGANSVTLNASVFAEYQDMNITTYPTADGYIGSWQVEDPDGNVVTTGFEMTNLDPDSTLDPMEDPQAIFTAESLGEYNFKWILTPTAVDENDILIDNSGCPPVENPNNVTLIDCTTLDFDGDDDYIDLGNNYTGNIFIEAWIRPFDRPIDGGGTTDATTGVIFSSSGFEIRMENLPSEIKDDINNVDNDGTVRWYHIAVANNGDLWVDGISAGRIDVNGSGINNTSIGARYNANTKTTSNHFSGWIEELRIWNGNNAPSEDEIRFMMNQRIKLNPGANANDPIEGEIVPNRSVPGSYLVDGSGNNLHFEGYSGSSETTTPFYVQSWGDLAGYYRLYSDNPDPLNLTECAIFDENLKPNGGYTPDHAINKVPGRLVNITTDQQNTSPTPYCSGQDGQWATINTWARPNVWDFPNSTYDSTPLEWNIARINHNISSANKDITMLGLLSETLNKELTIESDQVIRISHYLLLDGNMDLVRESQLLQDHGSILAEQSRGWLERDQQGRRSSYDYNYWTSPVSNQGAANNSGFQLSQVLFDATYGISEDDPIAIDFRDGYFVADIPRPSPIIISNYWIWEFRGGTADIYADWHYLGSTGHEITGAGYTMKGTDGTVDFSDPISNFSEQNYAFRGKPNNGTIQLSIGQNQNYLVGNPYASAIDAWEFMLDNLPSSVTAPNGKTGRNTGSQAFNGTLYYWDHFAGNTHILEEYIGGYAYYSFGGNTPAYSSDWRINNSDPNSTSGRLAKRYIPVAQGFFVNSSGGYSGNFKFKNSQRAFVGDDDNGDPSIFLIHEDRIKSSANSTSSSNLFDDDQRAKIRLKFQSPAGYHRQILVTRDTGTTNGFDLGYDAPLIENNMEDMYWVVDDSNYVIQAVPDFEKDQVLPLAIKTKAEGQFTIKIDSTENWPTGKQIFLKDKQMDSIHDILSSPYVGTAGEGENKERFEIVFHNPNDDVVTTDPDPIDPDPTDPTNPDDLPVIDGLVGISYSHFSRKVKISNFDLLDVSKVMIFDMNGKLIQEFDGLPTQNEILLSLRPVRSGVYIVKAFCENGICNKKIVVK